jgi:hypothetical protein
MTRIMRMKWDDMKVETMVDTRLQAAKPRGGSSLQQ